METPRTLEREIKLRYSSPHEARAAVLRAGAAPLRARRLQDDRLLDTADDSLRRQQCALRIRTESGRAFLTLKGPVVEESGMKVREELETPIDDGILLLRIFERLGFHVWFRYQKYREEYAYEDVVVAIDETPVGTFVEMEGDERGITNLAAILSRTPADYVLDSYRGLFVRHRHERGLPDGDMVFPETV